jgi:cysteine-rich repeat protein
MPNQAGVGGASGASGNSGNSQGGTSGGGAAGRGAGDAGESGAYGDGGTTGSSVCGDGLVGTSERCDDRNPNASDGCSPECRVESGWRCDGSEPTVCEEICGDGTLVGAEAIAGGCDDGNTDDDDGCSATCSVQGGFLCGDEPSVCTPVDDCNPDPCENGGVCIDGDDAYTCQCGGTGFEGPSCETNVDDCSPNPCENGGACTDEVNGFSCNCSSTGYTGDTCRTNVDDCVPNPCGNGGTCTDGVNDYTCECITGYTGKDCESVDDCAGNSCLNGGTCVDGVDDYTCDCDRTGFTGANCETDSGWTRQFGSSVSDNGQAVALDSSGNAYVLGYTDGTFSGQSSAGGTFDAFVVKYDASGANLWTKQFGTAAIDYGESAAVDSIGNLYVSGTTYGTFAGEIRAGNEDSFVGKFDGSGTLLWARQLGTADFDMGLGVCVDSSGNVYATGRTNGTFPGQSRSGVQDDAFVAKYDSTGALQWVRQLGTDRFDSSYAVSVDSTGNPYIAGYTSGTFPGQADAGGNDAFVAKYDGAGTLQWLRQFGTSRNVIARGVSVDSSGGAYVVGYAQGALSGELTKGGYDAFVIKYDSAGTWQWTRQFGTSATDYGLGISVDAGGNAYVAGSTTGVLAGQSNAGAEDAFIVKYSASGTLQWARQFGTSTPDQALAVRATPSGTSYVAGYTEGTFPGQSSAGGVDAFVRQVAP